jgi:hypothetical protein
VARAMHLGGRLRREVAQRIWPGWLDRVDRQRSSSRRSDR